MRNHIEQWNIVSCSFVFYYHETQPVFFYIWNTPYIIVGLALKKCLARPIMLCPSSLTDMNKMFQMSFECHGKIHRPLIESKPQKNNVFVISFFFVLYDFCAYKTPCRSNEQRSAAQHVCRIALSLSPYFC